MFRSFRTAKALTAGLVFAACACAANITYSGSGIATSNSVDTPFVYTITTNGTLGTLSPTDLVGMSLGLDLNSLVDMGSNTHTLSGALTATQTELSFNFGIHPWLFQFDNFGSSWNFVLGSNEGGGYLGVVIGDQYRGVISAVVGAQATAQFASAPEAPSVPEPSTVALMVAPLALAFVTRKRSKV